MTRVCLNKSFLEGMAIHPISITFLYDKIDCLLCMYSVCSMYASLKLISMDVLSLTKVTEMQWVSRACALACVSCAHIVIFYRKVAGVLYKVKTMYICKCRVNPIE